MTGPPYPRPPAPGSNAIGLFTIGVSPIGTIEPFNWWDTVISQYANSPILMGMLQNFSDCIDQTQNFDNFFDNIWNVNTATGYGLDVWGRIVGVSRVLELPSGTYFGMEGPSGVSGDPWNVSPFYSGNPETSNYSLTDLAYRQLILTKALSNVSDGSIRSINTLLMTLFPNQGNCYCTDGENMTMTYTFEFALNPVQDAIVTQSGVLPKSVGVSTSVVQI